MSSNNLTLLTDLYQLTMMQGYYNSDINNEIAVFDMYYRRNPCGNGYSIAAGLAQVIEYIENLKFTDEDIAYLKTLQCFEHDFLNTLKNFKFSGDIHAVKEGTVVFPNEPLIRVKAPMFQAQLIETTLLNIINHQSLIATKAARVVYAANGNNVLEFGLRRAQGPDAGLFGSRAAVIGGCSSTSNVLAGKIFDIPVSGTHAHSWVMNFPDELTAFRHYAKTFPSNCILLVDTYDIINSGIPNAIKVFDELAENNTPLKNYGIRLDSGDLAYFSKIARKLLDEAGHTNAVIAASSDLDEYLIRDLKLQGAKINVWGVGTSLITSSDCPAFGGVYKLSAKIDKENNIIPKIKISENTSKVTNPGIKKIYRLFNKRDKKIKADLITLQHETIDTSKDLTIFDPVSTWKKMTLKANTFTAEELLIPIFINGICVYNSPSVSKIREYCKKQTACLWEEHKRLINPHIIPVDLSLELWTLKSEMIKSFVSK